MPDMAVTIQLSAQDDASAALAKVRDALGGVGDAAKETSAKADETRSAFDRIKQGMEEGFGLALGYAGFRDLRDVMESTIDTVIGFNAELETMSVRLENLTGSVGATTEALQAVREQAEASPFEFKDIEAGEERLLRFNFSIDDSTKLLKVASDAAAGGAGSVDLITEAFGRMNTKQELTSRGLMSLTAAGIPVFDMLAKGLNVSTAEAEELVKKGLIPAKEGIDILATAIEAKFPDMAAKVATGFDATVKNLKETIQFAAAEMGKPLFDVLESAVRDALAFLKSPDVKGALDDFSHNVASTIGDVVDWFKQLGRAMSQPEVQVNLRSAWDELRTAGTLLWGMVKDFEGELLKLNDSMADSTGKSATLDGQVALLSKDIRSAAQVVKDAVQEMKDFGDALNSAKDAGDRFALWLHNGLIFEVQLALTPVQALVNLLTDFETLADKTFHIKIDIPGQAGLQAFLDSIHGVQTTDAGTATSTGGPGGIPNLYGDASALRPSQFNDPALSADEAAAACGPAAAVAFAKANGMYPTLRQAQDIAEKIGWTPGGGMNGVGNEQTLLTNMGLSGSLNQSPSALQIQTGANTGSGEIISTPGHFFTATGYDVTTGKYNVGTSGTDLRGGSASMTLDQMTNLEGEVTGIITDIHSLTSNAASGTTSSWQDTARKDANKYGIDPVLYVRQMQEEGGLNPDGSPRTSPAGAVGVAQFMPGTAAALHVDPTNTNASLDAGAKYMAQLIKDNGGDVRKALMAYNAGQGNVDSGAAATFPETQGYVADIMTGTGRASGAPGSPGAAAQAGPPAPGTGNTSELNAIAQPYLDKFAKLIAEYQPRLTKIQTTEDRSLASATEQYGPGGTADEAADREAASKLRALDASHAAQEDAKKRKEAVAEEVQADTDKNNHQLAAAALIYSRQLQDQATIHSRKLEDDQILANQQLANVQLVHQRDLQDAQTVHQQMLALAATKHAQELQDAQTLVSQQLANTELLHQRSLQDAQIAPTEQLQAQALVHSRKLEDTEVQYQYERDLGKATTDAQRAQLATAHQDALENLAHQRQLQDAEIVYQQGLAATALKVQRDAQDTEIKYQDDQKAQQLVKQRADAATESQYQMGLAATETAYQRSLQDTEITYQQGIAAQALVRSRALADQETAYQRGLEDVAVQHNLELETAARAFTKQEKAKVDAVDKALADEAFKRQQDQIAADLLAKKASIAEEYKTRVAAALQTAKDARDALKESFDQAAQDQIDAAQKALAGFNGAGDPIIARMKADWATFDDALATATADITGNALKIQTAQDATAARATADAAIVTTATTTASDDYAQSAEDISKSLGITDLAVETYADRSHQLWDAARVDLNTMVSTYGVGSEKISAAFGITDHAVEQFALDHHTDWEKARVDLNTAAIHASEVLGDGGTIPKAAGITTAAFDSVQTAASKTSALDQLKHTAQDLADHGLDPASKAARDLQTAIDDLKDKTITVTTKYVNSGQPTGGGGSVGPSGSAIAGGESPTVPNSGGGGGGSSSGTVGTPGNPSGTPTHPGESGPGGIYNDPTTGRPYDTGGWLPTGLSFAYNGTGQPERVLGPGEDMIDYDKLAAALAKQPIVVNMDGRTVAEVVRTELLKIGARSGSIFGGRA